MNLFRQCFFLSMFTFGGGSAIIAMIQKQFVEDLEWIDRGQMLEMVTLAQSVPGATSVNTAILIGYHIFGLRGALISALGTSLPPLIVIILITMFYDWIRSNTVIACALRGVRACAAALVASVSLSLLTSFLKKRDLLLVAVLVCSGIALWCFHLSALTLILAGLAVSPLYIYSTARREKEDKP